MLNKTNKTPAADKAIADKVVADKAVADKAIADNKSAKTKLIKVTFLKSPTGEYGFAYNAGEEAKVPEVIAKDMIENGYATK